MTIYAKEQGIHLAQEVIVLDHIKETANQNILLLDLLPQVLELFSDAWKQVDKSNRNREIINAVQRLVDKGYLRIFPEGLECRLVYVDKQLDNKSLKDLKEHYLYFVTELLLIAPLTTVDPLPFAEEKFQELLEVWGAYFRLTPD